MRLIGRERLSRLRGQGEDIDKWVRSWLAEVTDAHWRGSVDVLDQFPNAQDRGAGRFAFPVFGSHYQIHLQIAFVQGIALVAQSPPNE